MAVEMAVHQGLVESFSDPNHSVFGLYKPNFWWWLGSNQRREAYESLLAGSPPFASIQFSLSARQKSGDANSRE
jgi:hypothetical protein